MCDVQCRVVHVYEHSKPPFVPLNSLRTGAVDLCGDPALQGMGVPFSTAAAPLAGWPPWAPPH